MSVVEGHESAGVAADALAQNWRAGLDGGGMSGGMISSVADSVQLFPMATGAPRICSPRAQRRAASRVSNT
jgi:hypothetical protein